jgi:hypothetical protein
MFYTAMLSMKSFQVHHDGNMMMMIMMVMIVPVQCLKLTQLLTVNIIKGCVGPAS